jgi:hypothetical protein
MSDRPAICLQMLNRILWAGQQFLDFSPFLRYI